MADREYVESVWACEIEVLVIEDAEPRFCSASVRPRQLMRSFVRTTLDDAWSAAAEFTRNRLEEIRKLRVDIRRLEAECASHLDQLDSDMHFGLPSIFAEVRRITSFSRILDRERAQLGTLTQGIKPEAL